MDYGLALQQWTTTSSTSSSDLSSPSGVYYARVHNLQHDGLLISTVRNTTFQTLAGALTTVCSKALHYPQPVEVK